MYGDWGGTLNLSPPKRGKTLSDESAAISFSFFFLLAKRASSHIWGKNIQESLLHVQQQKQEKRNEKATDSKHRSICLQYSHRSL